MCPVLEFFFFFFSLQSQRAESLAVATISCQSYLALLLKVRMYLGWRLGTSFCLIWFFIPVLMQPFCFVFLLTFLPLICFVPFFFTVYSTVIMITTLSINMFYSSFYTVYSTVIMITALSVNRNKHMSKPQT